MLISIFLNHYLKLGLALYPDLTLIVMLKSFVEILDGYFSKILIHVNKSGFFDKMLILCGFCPKQNWTDTGWRYSARARKKNRNMLVHRHTTTHCSVFLRVENQIRAQARWSVVNMIIINDFVNDVSNFLKKSPRDTCEVSNWISFFQRFQKLYLIQHSIKFCCFTLPPGVYLLWSLILIKFFSFCSKLFFITNTYLTFFG